MFKLVMRVSGMDVTHLHWLQMCCLFCFILSATVTVFSPSSAASVCGDLSRSFPPVGTMLPGGSLIEQLATRSGSTFNLRPKMPDGLELRSQIHGTARCQSNSMIQNISGKERIIDIGGFEGGEGALCGDDRVFLVTISNKPALLDADGSQPGKLDLTIASRYGAGWSQACGIKMTLTSKYGAERSYCPGANCAELANASIQEADAIARQQEADTIAGQSASLTIAPDLNGLTVPERALWDQMTRLYENENPNGASGIATFGQDRSSGNIDVNVGWDTSVFPVQLNGRLLLGTIGTAGFGSKFGEDKGSTIFGLKNGSLEPVAGFYLNVDGRIITAVEVDNEKQ